MTAPVAAAQSSGSGYGGASGVAGTTEFGGVAGTTEQGAVAGQSGVPGDGANGRDQALASEAMDGNGVLAFTGLDIALLVGGGLMLLAAGFVLRGLVGGETKNAP